MTWWSTTEPRRTADDAKATRSDPGRGPLLASAFVPAWVVLGGLTLLAALGATFPAELGLALVLGSVLFVGLPHGAVDHLFVRRLVSEAGSTADRSGRRTNGPPTIRTIRARAASRPFLTVGVLYVVLGGAYLLGWFLAPAAAFVAFLLLTWVHWGLGDLWGLVAISGGGHLGTRAQRALAATVRGAIPMLVPLVAHPAEYRAVAVRVVGAFDPGAAAVLSVGFDSTARVLVGTGLVVAVAVSLAVGYRRATRVDEWAVDAGETLLLVAFFATVPPVLAIGVYFPLWHSLRHVQRVELLDPPAVEGLRRGDFRPALVRFARDATPLTGGALLVFAGLFVFVPGASAGVEGTVAVYLVLLAVLTLPHAVIAAWADVRQGVWSR